MEVVSSLDLVHRECQSKCPDPYSSYLKGRRKYGGDRVWRNAMSLELCPWAARIFFFFLRIYNILGYPEGQ